MKKQIIVLLAIVMAGMQGNLRGQVPVAKDWQIFIDSSGIQSPKARGKDASYALLAVEAGTLLHEIQSAGIEVIRQLDGNHFVIQRSAMEKGHKQQAFILWQYPLNQLWKLSPALLAQRETVDPGKRALFTIKVLSPSLFKNQAALISDLLITGDYSISGLLQIRCTYQTLFQSLLPLDQLIFVEEASPPAREESMLRDANLAVNKVNLVHHQYPQLNGSGIVASVKENSFDAADLDLRGRALLSEHASGINSRHATEMATILAGAGNTAPQSKGIAPAARLVSSDFAWLHPDPVEYFTAYRITVQNHSYGTSTENYYGSLAHAYDLHTHQNPQLMHVFSAGNTGTVTDSLGTYKSAPGYANISGNLKMAKNTLLVAAVDTLKTLDSRVSKGPAYDGRVKPELVAYSSEGSSNASALVAGVGCLLQQQYKAQHHRIPAAALLKALLVNSAEDVGPPGIDFFSGYGNVDAYKALRNIREQRFFSASIVHQQELSFALPVPAHARNLKISLAWSDPAAQPNAAKALVNDLDLSLVQEETGKRWLPWVLNPYPHPDSLQLPARRGVDHLNTIEQISLAQPEPGDYRIKITGYDIPQGVQEFFVCYQWDEDRHFSWTYPSGSDNMPNPGERSSIFRWESTYSGEKGLLEYSLDKGQSWILIDPAVDLSQEFYTWTAPAIYAGAMARMQVESQVYTSDHFSISRPLSTSVGFNCRDSVMLSWQSAPGVEGYTLYKLGEKYMEPIKLGQDTFFIFKKEEIREPYFALAPRLGNGLEGTVSPAFDYTMQGVACYLAYFNASLKEDGVQLSLQLGSSYQLQQIFFERLEGQSYTPIGSFAPPSGHSLIYHDTRAKQGLNQYRVRLRTLGGQEILSEELKIYFLSHDSFLVFPNPLTRQQELKVYTNDFNTEEVYLQLSTADGKVVLEKELDSSREAFPIGSLNPGMYIYTISAGTTRSSGKLIVY